MFPPFFLKILLVLILVVEAASGLALAASWVSAPTCFVVVIPTSSAHILLGTLALGEGCGVFNAILVFHSRLGFFHLPFLFLGLRGSQCSAWLFAYLGCRVGFLWEIALFIAHSDQVGHTGLISSQIFPLFGQVLFNGQGYIVHMFLERGSARGELRGCEFGVNSGQAVSASVIVLLDVGV